MVEILSDAGGPGGESTLPVDRCGIAVADVAELVAANEALPLLGEVNMGPIFYCGTWWVLEGSGTPEGVIYTVAAPTDQLELTARCLLLARTDEILAETATDRQRDRTTDAAATDDVPARWYR